ncbi:uncharacterized protein LOC127764638 isoform X3 [Oryza glaberrima]|uniref:uncharacterized protein LOC127764638 isoform X3 n=1 Tax=Oryza glaberrima TaxID=4538 RepID=UPI00224C376E|nr:uncharacterized protein LOC127764638 isoform X3 [Oryza glaberrima]
MEVEEKSQRGEDCKKTKDLESANIIQDLRNMKSTGLTDENLKGFVGGILKDLTERDKNIEKKTISKDEGLGLLEQNYNTMRSYMLEDGKGDTKTGEQDMNYAEEIHQTNVLSLLDQDFIDDKFTSYTSLMEHIISSQPTRCNDLENSMLESSSTNVDFNYNLVNEVEQNGNDSMQTVIDAKNMSEVIPEMNFEAQVDSVQPWSLDLFNLQESIESSILSSEAKVLLKLILI